MDKKRILVVEDEKNIATLVAYNLMQAGYAYEVAFDGEDGLKKALTNSFDLILLDIMLPKMDGFEVCRQVRKKLATPIIFVTAREEDIDKIMGLDIGADAYVTKPFSVKVLLSMINANIRRSANEVIAKQDIPNADKVIRIRGLEIDGERYQVSKDGELIELTKNEYELLVYLAHHVGKICSREELLEQVWGYDDFYGDMRTVDVTVRRLRSKVEEDPARPEYLFSKRSMGYYVK